MRVSRRSGWRHGFGRAAAPPTVRSERRALRLHQTGREHIRGPLVGLPADRVVRRTGGHGGARYRHRRAEHVVGRPVRRGQLAGLRPGAPAQGEHVAGALIGVPTNRVVGSPHNRGRAGDGHRGAEQVAGRPIRRGQFAGLRPGAPAQGEHVAGPLIGVPANRVVRRAHRHRRARDRHRRAEHVAGRPIRRGQLAGLRPGAPAQREHVAGPLIGVSADGVVRRAGGHGRAGDGHGAAEHVAGRPIRRGQLAGLRPGAPAQREHVGGALIGVPAYGVVRGTDHDGGTRDGHGGAEQVARRPIRRGQLAGLRPGAPAQGEHIGGALVGVAADGVVRGADHDGGARDRHRRAEQVARRPIRHGELAGLRPGAPAQGEHVGGALGGVAADGVVGRADDRGRSRNRHRGAEQVAGCAVGGGGFDNLRPGRIDSQGVAGCGVVHLDADRVAL